MESSVEQFDVCVSHSVYSEALANYCRLSPTNSVSNWDPNLDLSPDFRSQESYTYTCKKSRSKVTRFKSCGRTEVIVLPAVLTPSVC